jgi:acetyltransferase-like isoleucine patch superfamily enzyme
LTSDDPQVPANVRLGEGARISGPQAFKRFMSRREVAVTLGARSHADGAHFAIGTGGCVSIGEDCYLNDCFLLVEEEVRIGNHVMIGWGATIADSDFHPIAPAERMKDAIALAEGRARPRIVSKPVVVGDDVYIGPACSILKGVTIGAGAFIEPGSVVTRDVPAGAHVRGNPAAVVSADENG